MREKRCPGVSEKRDGYACMDTARGGAVVWGVRGCPAARDAGPGVDARSDEAALVSL